MNELVELNLNKGQLAEMIDLFGAPNKDDMGKGVADSFAVVSFRGKVWRIKYKGEEKVVRNGDGDPVSSLFAVIVNSSPDLSKIYYKKRYEEGDDAAPDCFSVDGHKPDPTSPNKQSSLCATCKHNVFGSAITESGSKAKACADNRRIAIVPAKDPHNETFGGPMMLRVPPASLQAYKQVGDSLTRQGLHYRAVVMKMSFDSDVAYPKLTFTPVEVLEKEHWPTIKEHLESDTLDRIFQEPVEAEEGESSPTADTQKPEPAEDEKPKAKKRKISDSPEDRKEDVKAETKSEKPSAKEANSADADDVGEDISNLITGLLK